MVAPPPVKRIQTMDVLRGFAVLGILFANISAFCEPIMRTQMPVDTWGLTLDDQWAHTIREVFISGKMRSLLAILFGVGLWMQFAKRRALEVIEEQALGIDQTGIQHLPVKPKKLWPGSYLKRTLLLAGIGIFHALFIWFGDILFTYALCALLAIVFVRVNEKVLSWVIVGLIGIGVLAAAAMSISMGSSAESAESLSFWKTMPIIGVNAEVAAYSTGTYLSQFLHRLGMFFLNGLSLFFIGPPIFGLFLLGMLLGRRGTFSGGEKAAKDIKMMMLIGLGLGIPLNLLPLLGQFFGRPELFTLVIEGGFAPILAVGILGFSLKVIPLLPSFLYDPFRRVGRVALSVYLLQSILATALFYSWGFRLYDTLAWQGQLIAVLSIMTICIVAANIYTRIFSIGPVEWVWRSLSEGKRLPWREPLQAAG